MRLVASCHRNYWNAGNFNKIWPRILLQLVFLFKTFSSSSIFFSFSFNDWSNSQICFLVLSSDRSILWYFSARNAWLLSIWSHSAFTAWILARIGFISSLIRLRIVGWSYSFHNFMNVSLYKALATYKLYIKT